MSAFAPASIDAPILDIIIAFGKLSHCFTLQSCYGHFVWPGQPGAENLELLPVDGTGSVRYRIAYVALCIEEGAAGARLRDALARISAVDTKCVQFGSPDWFWKQYPNSYAVQVEPARFAAQDEAVVEYTEALRLQGVRDEFFRRLRELAAGARG